jgi:uncharacterized damage-inducible protein DinB
MSISEPLLQELVHEMAGVRATFERVPPDSLDWTPHEKSMTFRGLVTHLANLPKWGRMTVETAEYDFAPDGVPEREEPVESIEAALAAFDENVRGFEDALRAASDDDLTRPWALKANGEVVFEMPRIAALRGMIMNHAIHHRAQLALYLRLNDVRVPALYGPTADDASAAASR